MKVGQALLLTLDRVVKGLRRRLRGFYYSRVLKSMGTGSQICGGVLIAGAQNVSFGDRVSVNDRVIIQSCEGAEVTVGNHVTLSYGVQLITGGLIIGDDGAVHGHHEAKPITLADSAWIGAGAIILPGITVGRGAIVAAGSVVTQDVEPFTLVGGAPAKLIRRIHGKDK